MTARRLILFVCLALGAVALAGRLTPRDLALFAAMSIVIYLVIGGTSPSTATIRFRPLNRGYAAPDEQAINCSPLFFAAWFFFRTATGRRWPYLFLLLFALGMLYYTRSRTALAALREKLRREEV